MCWLLPNSDCRSVTTPLFSHENLAKKCSTAHASFKKMCMELDKCLPCYELRHLVWANNPFGVFLFFYKFNLKPQTEDRDEAIKIQFSRLDWMYCCSNCVLLAESIAALLQGACSTRRMNIVFVMPIFLGHHWGSNISPFLICLCALFNCLIPLNKLQSELHDWKSTLKLGQ